MWTHRFAILTARAAFTLMLVGGTVYGGVYGAGSSLLVMQRAAITGPQEVHRPTDKQSVIPERFVRSVVASQGGVA
jgi:hypothetical protein